MVVYNHFSVFVSEILNRLNPNSCQIGQTVFQPSKCLEIWSDLFSIGCSQLVKVSDEHLPQKLLPPFDSNRKAKVNNCRNCMQASVSFAVLYSTKFPAWSVVHAQVCILTGEEVSSYDHLGNSFGWNQWWTILTPLTGNTDTAQALDLARIYAHDPTYGRRDGVRSVAVIITDGISTRNHQYTVQVTTTATLNSFRTSLHLERYVAWLKMFILMLDCSASVENSGVISVWVSSCLWCVNCLLQGRKLSSSDSLGEEF